MASHSVVTSSMVGLCRQIRDDRCGKAKRILGKPSPMPELDADVDVDSEAILGNMLRNIYFVLNAVMHSFKLRHVVILVGTVDILVRSAVGVRDGWGLNEDAATEMYVSSIVSFLSPSGN